MRVTSEQILQALSTVVEPERGKSIVRLNMVKGLTVDGATVSFTVMLKHPGTAFARGVVAACRQAIHEHVGPDLDVRVETDAEMIGLGDDIQISGGGASEPPGPPPGVLNFVAVASGKGGVGKSTVAANLAVALARQGYDVGLVDTDIYGPSVPTMFGVRDEKPRVNDRRKIIPLERHGVRLLSMGFMVDPARAVIWRGPMVSSAVRQFLGDAEWGELDYLILDLPPGTGDIQLTIVQTIPLTAAIVVSTPQDVALADARKGVAMFENVQVPVLGIVENMAYFTPPDLPDRKYYLFGRGGARKLAGELGVPFLGEIPIEQVVRETGDTGTPVVLAEPESVSARAFHRLAEETVRQVTLRNAEAPPTQKVEILHR
ncbi:MAG: iron-sulfur cluster carrier protein ApbC [Bacteroidetes bacterium]|nr:MRP family ATP-binding protein [Rhodothermaceae bacterium RA]RMH60525.1 MAG: iron-sulfur cluster carrier protein ApbC [Bacteroidota bacterium]